MNTFSNNKSNNTGILLEVIPLQDGKVSISLTKKSEGTININDYYTELLSLLNSLDIIEEISFENITVNNELTDFLLFLKELVGEEFFYGKTFNFTECHFPRDTNLMNCTFKGMSINIKQSEIEDLHSFKDFKGKKLTIKDSSFLHYSNIIRKPTEKNIIPQEIIISKEHRYSPYIIVSYGTVNLKMYTSIERILLQTFQDAHLYINETTPQRTGLTDYILEFYMLISRLGDFNFRSCDITRFEISNFTITKETIAMLKELYFDTEQAQRPLGYYFKSCYIESGARFGNLSVAGLDINKSMIEDFNCFNGLSAKELYIKQSDIKRYSGNVVLYCNKIVLNRTNINYKHFFLKTTAPDTETLEIYNRKDQKEEDFYFISCFGNVSSLRFSNLLIDKNNRQFDYLQNLIECKGICLDKLVLYGGFYFGNPPYKPVRERFPNVFKILILTNDELQEHISKNHKTFEEARRELIAIEERRMKIIEMALREGQMPLVPEDEILIIGNTPTSLEKHTTSLPLSSEEGIDYYTINPEERIIKPHYLAKRLIKVDNYNRINK